MKKILLMLMLFTVCVSACKKDKLSPTELLTSKMLGVWRWETLVITTTPQGGTGTDATTTKDTYAYIDFQAANKMFFSSNGFATVPDSWDPQDDKSFILGEETRLCHIQTSDDKNLVFYFEVTEANTVYRYTYKLSRPYTPPQV